jgi:hypothetical protein
MNKGVQSVYREFDDGKRIVVWITRDMDDVNNVPWQVPPIEDHELHVVPFPPPPLGVKGPPRFNLDDTVDGTLEAGYQCEQCRFRVEGGTWSLSHGYRFDYCRCAVAIRTPDSDWNSILTNSETWQQCISTIDEARAREGRQPQEPPPE